MIPTSKRTRFAAVTVAAVSLGLAATGWSSAAADDHDQAQPAAAGQPIPQAAAIHGAAVTEGTIRPLGTTPPDHAGIGGTAWLMRYDTGTTVTMKVTGLTAGDEYMAHLHVKPCNDDNGGGHFKFDPDGNDEPPNEVHLAFSADSSGTGVATVNNDKRVDAGAKSIVVHSSAATDNRIACADF